MKFRGKSISKAIAKANEKYPTEALLVDNDHLADVQAHYEYLADHDAISEKLEILKQIVSTIPAIVSTHSGSSWAPFRAS